MLFFGVCFFISNQIVCWLDNKRHVKRKRKSIAENVAYLFWQYFKMNVNKCKNCIVIDDIRYKFVM